MALGTSTLSNEQGHTTMRPNGMLRLSFAGDDSYPTGGTLAFGATYLLAETSKPLTVTDVRGYGTDGTDITHFVRYDIATDALLVYLMTGVQVGAAVDLSTTTFDIVVSYQ
jgi:hypothetical protein